MGMNFNLNEEDTGANPIVGGAAKSLIDKSLETLKSMKDKDNTLSSDSKGGSKMPEVAILKNGIKLGCLKDGQIGRPPSTGRFSYRKKSKKDPNKKIDYFADLTYRFTDGSKKGKWKCDGIFNFTPNVDPDQLQGPVKPSQEQQNYINDLIKSEGAIKEKPSQYQIDKGAYEVIDLNSRNPGLFPKKGMFFVYKQKGVVNQEVSGAQSKIIQSFLDRGFRKEPPNPNESLKWIKQNLRTIDNNKYGQYFDTDFFMYQPIENVDVADLIQGQEDEFKQQQVSKKQCREVIDILYTAYVNGYKMADNKRRAYKEYARRCDVQKEFILPGVNKKLDTLKNLNSAHPSLLSLRLQDNVNEGRLKSLVRESLVNAKKQKTKTLLQERKIVKNRLFFLTENVSVRTKKDKDKFCETLLTEMFYLNNQGFDKKVISEGFWDMIGGIFGKSGSGILGYFKEYLAKWLVTKFTPLDPKGWIGGTIIRAIGNLAIGDIPNLTNCNFLSKLLSKSIAEESIEQLKNRAGLEGPFYDILRNALVDSLEETELGTKIESALGDFLCPLLSGVSEKMSGAADKMKTGALSVG